MARTALTVQQLGKLTPTRLTYSVLTGFTGFTFQNTGREVVAIINGATASTYAVKIGATVSGQAVTDITGNLPTSQTDPEFYGPFPLTFNQSDGSVYIDIGTVTTVTVAIMGQVGY